MFATSRVQAPGRLVRITACILESLPLSFVPAEFEVVNLDVTNAKAISDHFRIAMAATFPATTRSDVLLEASQVQLDVSGLDIVRQEAPVADAARMAVMFESRPRKMGEWRPRLVQRGTSLTGRSSRKRAGAFPT